MKFKIVVGTIFFVLGIIVTSIGIRFTRLYIEGYFQPKERDVQRRVFEKTRSFNEAKKQELLKVYKEYLTADEKTKKGLRTYVSHAFADYDITRLDPKLQKFVKECRGF